jgi:hypothetical protein
MKKNCPTESTTSRSKTLEHQVFKLITGEEVIAVAESTRKTFILHDPYFILKDYRNEKTIYQIDKWMPYIDSPSLVIEQKSVICYNKPNEELITFYELVKKAESKESDDYFHDYSGQIH